MKTTITKLILAAAALVVAGTAAAQIEAPVQVKTDVPWVPAHMRAPLEAKALEGPTALMRYVNRTRTMGYPVRVEDIVVTPEDMARINAVRNRERQVAAKADEAAKKEQQVAAKADDAKK